MIFSRDGKYIISGSKDKSIKIFDVQTKELVHQFADVHNGKFSYDLQSPKYNKGGVLSLSISLDGKYIVSGSEDKSLQLYNIHTNELVHQFLAAHEGIFFLRFFPQSSFK